MSAALSAAVSLMPLDGSPSSSKLCSASRRLSTLSALMPAAVAGRLASVSGVTVAPQVALPSTSAPTLKRTVSPSLHTNSPRAFVWALVAVPAS